MNLLIVIAIGFTGGVAGGLFGIGGAVIIIPALVFFAKFSQINAQGTTLLAMIPPIGILAALQYYRAGHADIKTAAIIAAGFILGAYFGSKIALNINPVYMEKVFGLVLLYISFRMIIG